MNIYEVQPIFSHPPHPFELTIDAPGSKSITNRALMLAALANGETLLKGALFSDDSRHFLQCLKDLGFDVVVDERPIPFASQVLAAASRKKQPLSMLEVPEPLPVS